LAAHNNAKRARAIAQHHATRAVKALVGGDTILHNAHDRLCAAANRLVTSYGEIERNHRAAAARHNELAEEPTEIEKAEAFFHRVSRH
jgi:hypothetical protein